MYVFSFNFSWRTSFTKCLLSECCQWQSLVLLCVCAKLGLKDLVKIPVSWRNQIHREMFSTSHLAAWSMDETKVHECWLLIRRNHNLVTMIELICNTFKTSIFYEHDAEVYCTRNEGLQKYILKYSYNKLWWIHFYSLNTYFRGCHSLVQSINPWNLTCNANH